MRTNSVLRSVEARDAMVTSGTAEGMSEGYDRLDEPIAKLVAHH